MQGGWRGGSGVKSAQCSSRGPKFSPQHPHVGGSQLLQLQGDPTLSLASEGTCTLTHVETVRPAQNLK